ncbi:phage tail tape measure protein [Rhodopseudomonas sp. RCAM05734]|uniref:phage tail tape measure protein n=1 Tax=Rhodopseudomonas sp. RCAM05734 TaxID=3457549 RepID=UPI004043D196
MTAQTKALASGAATFAKAMTQAFATSVISGKQFDDVLKSLTLKMSDLALKAAFKPVEGALNGLLSGLTSSGSSGALQRNAQGAIKPFAAGGVVGTPSYFPMMDGGVGLAGEAGPEAIMPLRRGAHGRLGVAGASGGNSITVQIATPDPDSFRRSESYITGQIARAVARGQRSL